ncbi:MarR family winged helix-turn-helix transcriptional regulator [Flammeovirga kamogawensis]|uniref:MarR family transcriptional regulator n=1 Tax=Flammeovirga kamogawensis TaxID=373891 RepID=A0ABX8GU84_9BACT|nr:MarR family transcriptional regulator [Flammeovirga kamogawensis]MBB6459793.1 DNA-binding MarR family transcriptional regulator [Flammeovirga kamogawensis]QWG07150.1 MarR family transcriptional regulator [Flammeovirga kamogawensis]TRX68972.1 MarR family transcriptional regulator [Flammeovirga kamogawensis]
MKESNYIKAIYQIISTGHWITDRVGSELKEYGITEPQFNVLRILRGQNGNPITVFEILERMVQRSSNITRIVDKLLEKGLVNRVECPTNRRKMDITITPKGLETLKELDKKVETFHEPIRSNLTELEAETLAKLIIKLKGKQL